MAINSVGLNLLLQASPQQVQDLLQGLQPGTVLRGRIVDLLPQGKAVIQLNGQNLLAQLPAPASGQAFQKGDVLSLQVIPAPQNTPTQNSGSAANAQAVTLRIVPDTAGTGSTAPSAQNTPTRVALPPQAVIEQALIAAKVPVNSATLAAAKVLAAHGLPLDAQTLQSVVQTADSLLAAENAQTSASTTAAPTSSLPPTVRSLLQESLPALRLAVQTTPAAAPRLAFQQALALVEATLSGEVPAPPIDPLAQSQTAATAAAQDPAPAASLQSALQAVLSAPTPANLQALQLAIAVAAAAPSPPAAPTRSASAPISAGTNSVPSPAALPARREAAVLLVQSLPLAEPGQATWNPKTVSQAAQALIQALEDPQSPPAQTLVRAVQAQFPEAKPAQILQDAREALQTVVQHFDSLPASRPLPGPQALNAELEAAGIPVPQQSLNQLPRESVYEAVAWLKTRDLPPQRPLVEAAAQFLSRGQAALSLAEQTARVGDSLPEGLMTSRPSLKQAFVNLDQAIQRSTLKLDAPDLGAQLEQWPQVSGLDLEKALFQALEQAQSPANGPAGSQNPAAQPSLREALAQVQHEVKQALRDPAGSAPSVAPKLEQAATDAGRALQSLNALPLQAQPSPSFQTVTLPLALPLQGPLNGGQLSVTWRQGQERELNDKDPVNVVVALNTESLGEVRVLLQVWKGAVSASVKTEDKATADFLASGADDLKSGFAERTPFRVRGLDFSALPEGEAMPDLDQAAPLPQGAGVNLSA